MKNLLPFILIVLISLGSCRNKSSNSTSLTENSVKNTDTVFYQNKGIGKLIINFEETLFQHQSYVLNFYNYESDSNLIKTVEIKWNSDNNGFVEIFNAEFIKVKDYYIEEPHYILMFNCLRECNGFYEVVINTETNEKMWIKKEITKVFKPWDKFLKEVVCISALNPNANQIRMKPEDNSGIAMENIEDKCWEVESVYGEWIQVKCSEIDFDLSNEKYKNFNGWLKWRNDKDLLIEYYLAI